MQDEEIGGFEGMLLFLQSQEFKALNVGLALDEGLASPDDDYVAYYGERSPWCRLRSFILVGCLSRYGSLVFYVLVSL